MGNDWKLRIRNDKFKLLMENKNWNSASEITFQYIENHFQMAQLKQSKQGKQMDPRIWAYRHWFQLEYFRILCSFALSSAQFPFGLECLKNVETIQVFGPLIRLSTTELWKLKSIITNDYCCTLEILSTNVLIWKTKWFYF